MIIVDSQKLRFLLAGRPLTVEVHREYRKGRDYAVGKTFRKATCRAVVTDIERVGAKTWRITIKYQLEDKPVWLAKKNARCDYTQEKSKAMLDEPEPVDQATLKRYSAEATARDEPQRRSEAHRARIARKRAA